MKYTFQGDFVVLLNQKGRKLIDSQLEKLRCLECGAYLYRETSMDDETVYCERAYDHDNGYEIDMDSDPPRVKNGNNKSRRGKR